MLKRIVVMTALSMLLVACGTGTPNNTPGVNRDNMNEQRDNERPAEEAPNDDMGERQDRGVDERNDQFEEGDTLNRDPLKENNDNLDEDKR